MRSTFQPTPILKAVDYRSGRQPVAAKRPDAAQFLLNRQGHGGGTLSFWDALDVINPLQQIPGLSTLYRELTGDTILPAARLAGGALYGGPLGFAAAVADNALDSVTGKDMGGHVVAALRDDDGSAVTATTQVASASPLPPSLVAGQSESPKMAVSPLTNPFLTLSAERRHPSPLPAAVVEKVRILAAPHVKQVALADETETDTGNPFLNVAPARVAPAMMNALDKYKDMAIGRQKPNVIDAEF